MTVNVNASGLVARLNAAGPNTLADQLRTVGFGTVVRQLRTALRRQNPNAVAAGAASPYDLATLQVIFLPDDAKASGIARAYARATAASGTLGELSVVAPNTTPAADQVAVTPAGNIAFLGSQQYSDVDIDYDVAKQDVVEIVLTVASNTATIPAGVSGGAAVAGTPGSGVSAGVLMLMEAQATAGTSQGSKVVLAPGGTPAAGQACLNTAKTAVAFYATDAVTQARLKLGVCSAIDVNALLEAASGSY